MNRRKLSAAHRGTERRSQRSAEGWLRRLVFLTLASVALAQQPPATTAPAATGAAAGPATPSAPPPAAPAASTDAAKPADAAPAAAAPAAAAPAAAAAAAAPSPVPTGENWLTGFLELGYRWNTGTAGSVDTYRSIVDLGSGPKLLSTEFLIRDPKRRLFDRMEVRAYDWGGDPYSTLHVNLFKENSYQLITDYRNLAYFDNMPAFADPSLATSGFLLNQQSFDTHRRIGNVLLEIKPGSWLVPYLAYDHDSSDGDGVTTFVSNTNQFPFLSQMSDSTESYRAGVRLELPRFHVTLEQGGTTFKSAQNTFVPAGNVYLGSSPNPIGGPKLDLTSLAQAYGIRGSSLYTKGLLTAHVTRWMDLTGQFLYSQPSTSVNYQQYNYGSFASLNDVLFYNSEQNLVNAAAKMPHTTGSAGAEMRPLKHIRFVDTWMTDRLHNAADALQKDLLGTTPPQNITTDLTSALITNYSQVESDMFVDFWKGIVVRAGYRYVWGNADEIVLPPEGLVTHDRLRLQRNIVLGGVNYRAGSKFSIGGDFEAGTSATAYFPISLYDYQKFRIHSSYQLTGSLNFSANVSWLQNISPLPNKDNFLSNAESASLQWNPKSAKHISFLGTWEHSTLRSNIFYLPPQTLQATISNYWESGNTVTGLITATLPTVMGVTAQFSGGGSFLLSAGTNATAYYQPVGKLTVPFNRHFAWNTEWRYYGFGESFYLYQSFRTHLITTGVRYTR
jgi:hypothetical protein